MLIHINRKIFKALDGDNLPLRRDYVEQLVSTAYYNLLSQNEIDTIVDYIITVINQTEEVISKYGIEAWANDDYPAKDCVSGYYNSSGRLVLVPFDWSLDENNEFDYSFEVAVILSEDDNRAEGLI